MMTGSNREILDAAKATRRERLAGRALNGLIAANPYASCDVTAGKALRYADALIAELDKGKADD